jgi:ADP-ribosylglycohydrolase
MTRIQMRKILAGADWRQTAAAAFGGQGSMGNGSAMRVAPLGGYFADDLERVVAESKLSATVTHTHAEGVAGAIAVAVAAAMAWRLSNSPKGERMAELFEAVLRHTPESKVRQRLVIAAGTPMTVPTGTVAQALGNGSLVTAPDTVPFAIWCAASHLNDYAGALVATVSCGGDCDTNAAIVGGITALSAGRHSIPAEWRTAREALPFPQLNASGQ